MDKDQLAALDRAATQEADDIAYYSGSSSRHRPKQEAFHAALVNAYRANQLVLIGPDAVEKVARAMAAHVGFEWVDGPGEERSLLNKHEARTLATAALAALGVKP